MLKSLGIVRVVLQRQDAEAGSLNGASDSCQFPRDRRRFRATDDMAALIGSLVTLVV